MNLHDLWYDEWKFCGCGEPEKCCTFIRDALRLIDSRYSSGMSKEEHSAKWHEIVNFLGGDERPGLYWLFLYWADSNGLTEHGSSIDGAWLSPKGKEVLAILESSVDPYAEPLDIS
jgi:hypothetical protein